YSELLRRNVLCFLYHSPYTSHLFSFFFTATAATEIYTLSLHDALPIFDRGAQRRDVAGHLLGELRQGKAAVLPAHRTRVEDPELDRKSTRLNSSHVAISYAVFCLKKKKKENI